jgi:hypothetical protein
MVPVPLTAVPRKYEIFVCKELQFIKKILLQSKDC